MFVCRTNSSWASASDETTPPKPEAAAPLLRELNAIDWFVNQYLDQLGRDPQKDTLIASLTRVDLPEERGAAGGTQGGGSQSGGKKGGPAKGPGGGGGGGSAKPGGRNATGDLVHYFSFDVGAVCRQRRLQELLNVITGPKAPQFYVIRQIRTTNSAEKAPSKATPSPDATDKPTGPRYVLGEEVVVSLLRIDIVDFTPPADESTAAEKSTPAPKQP